MNDANQDKPRAPAHETTSTGRALFAELRHELRTPINAILGYSEILLEDAVEQGQSNLFADLENLHTAGTELLALVNTLLDPAEIERISREPEATSFGTLLHNALHTPTVNVMSCTERLLADATTHNQLHVVSDLQRIHAAAASFLMLIERGVDGEQHGDNQEDTSPTVEGHSAMQEHVVNASDQVKDTLSASLRHHGLVLVVDDNATNRDILMRRLQRAGHQGVAVENGRQALNILQTRPFDLVLLDIMMPEMNGYQVLQHIKADPAVQDIPVIMISALDELDSVVRCITLGAADYLLKPFNSVLLNARIGACLEQKRLRDQEVAYLRNVALVISAAAAVEAGAFKPGSLEEVAQRQDALGQLGRVFQRMADEVATREQQLRQQVQDLRIEIDEAKKAQQVAEITETEYFQQLQEKAQKLRAKSSR